MPRISQFKKELKPSQLEAVENLERQYEAEIQELYLQIHSLVTSNKSLSKDRDRYREIMKWIKKQYELDFTEDEIYDLEPRDTVIYNTIKSALGDIEN